MQNYLTELQSFLQVSTVLDGGLYTGNIYEACGPPASGKTQFCLQIVCKYTKKYQQKILYIDTKGDFCLHRLKQLAGGLEEKVFNNILIQRINSAHELISSLYQIKSVLGRSLKLRVIIIDSLPAVMYLNEGIERNNVIINCLVNILHCIAVEYHVVILVTNTITTWREDSDFGGTSSAVKKVGCGKRWQSVPNTRLEFTKLPCEQYDIRILKSSQLKEGTMCTVKLSNSGFI